MYHVYAEPDTTRVEEWHYTISFATLTFHWIADVGVGLHT